MYIFVHSYYLKADDENIVAATTEYGGTIIHASVQKDNIYACQFHPEKSSTVGLQVLKNFAAVIGLIMLNGDYMLFNRVML